MSNKNNPGSQSETFVQGWGLRVLNTSECGTSRLLRDAVAGSALNGHQVRCGREQTPSEVGQEGSGAKRAPARKASVHRGRADNRSKVRMRRPGEDAMTDS